MLRVYPNAQFTIFEPSRRYISALRTRFAGNARVHCVELALADFSGTAEFYETTLEGSGSLLQSASAAERDYALKAAERFPVQVTTLDSLLRQDGRTEMKLDMLWCDVQGGELAVLQGAERALRYCSSIFIEVAVWEPMYVGAPLYADVRAWLESKGFIDCILGVDPLNGTGNAFFVDPSKRGIHRTKL
jgi:FkbM family methyltransferase